VAAESLCELFQHLHGLPTIVLKTSRFFPEADDDPAMRRLYSDDNAKANEFLFRRVDIEDIVSAHVLALEKATAIGFGRYIISATSPFAEADCPLLNTDAPTVVRCYSPELEASYATHGFRMFPRIDRVYVNERARRELGWQPRYDFAHVLTRLREGKSIRSALADAIGAKGYHRAVAPS
jgi:UDP-glucose 4-epimerase